MSSKSRLVQLAGRRVDQRLFLETGSVRCIKKVHNEVILEMSIVLKTRPEWIQLCHARGKKREDGDVSQRDTICSQRPK